MLKEKYFFLKWPPPLEIWNEEPTTTLGFTERNYSACSLLQRDLELIVTVLHSCNFYWADKKNMKMIKM